MAKRDVYEHNQSRCSHGPGIRHNPYLWRRENPRCLRVGETLSLPDGQGSVMAA